MLVPQNSSNIPPSFGNIFYIYSESYIYLLCHTDCETDMIKHTNGTQTTFVIGHVLTLGTHELPLHLVSKNTSKLLDVGSLAEDHESTLRDQLYISDKLRFSELNLTHLPSSELAQFINTTLSDIGTLYQTSPVVWGLSIAGIIVIIILFIGTTWIICYCCCGRCRLPEELTFKYFLQFQCCQRVQPQPVRQDYQQSGNSSQQQQQQPRSRVQVQYRSVHTVEPTEVH